VIIAQILEPLSPEDARSVLYYIARYIKQAESFDDYEKDIFEDEQHNAPSGLVREMTRRLIEAIEARENMRAQEFNDKTVIRLLDEITSLETRLSPELSEAELERGASLAAAMLPPTHLPADD
jgi:hypothetical protein